MKRFSIVVIYLSVSIVLSAQEWNPDLTGSTVAIERFFYNGEENSANQQKIYFNDKNKIIMSAFLNKDGSERTRKIYYYENGEQVEYSIWDKNGKSWNRWLYSIVDITIEGENTIYTETTTRYEREKLITEIKIKNKNGGLVKLEQRGYDGYILVEEYNDSGLVNKRIYEHEKSNGQVVETIDYVFQGNLPVVKKVVSTDESYIVGMSYDSLGQLLNESYVFDDSSSNYEIHYQYNNNQVVSEKRSSDGEVYFDKFFEYNSSGNLIKWGESMISDHYSYDRYWFYDFIN